MNSTTYIEVFIVDLVVGNKSSIPITYYHTLELMKCHLVE